MRQMGSTRYVELAACGHVPMQEQPEAFCAAVAPFLSEVLGAAAAPTDAVSSRQGCVLREASAMEQDCMLALALLYAQAA